MNASTGHGTEFTALPGSQRKGAELLALQAGDAVRLLRLRAGQHCLLMVHGGRLWLTQDGQLDDQVLAAGQQLRLQGPGRFRCGAFGPEPLRARLQRG